MRESPSIREGMPTALIVDDEKDVRDMVGFNLVREGWSVLQAEDGLKAVRQAREHGPDVIILDLLLPEMDGYEVYETLQGYEETAGIPVLMLTAMGEERHRIRGLTLGADDYVTKPFSPRELILRVQNLTRRNPKSRNGADLAIGPFRVDRGTLKFYLDDEVIDLTSTEFKLLLILMENVGRDQPRNSLLRKIWGYDERIQTRTLDTHVKRLREKLGVHGDCIETVRGIGYRFRLPSNGA